MKTVCFVPAFKRKTTISIIAGFNFVLLHVSEKLTKHTHTCTCMHNNILTNLNLADTKSNCASACLTFN